MFSTFLTKELATSVNIKNRINRQNVIKILTKIKVNIGSKIFKNGIIIYCGVDNNNYEIFELIEPEYECNDFYYNCGKKFNTTYIDKYFSKNNGHIIFTSGNETIIYKYNGKFTKVKHINANLIKRHKKGGQSQKRFDKLAEESRMIYVTNIIDNLNTLNSDNNWIFGSQEILDMVLSRKKKVDIKNGGFLNFNKTTINDTKKFSQYLEISNNNNDDILKEMIYYLETGPDFLDFDMSNITNMKNFIIKDDHLYDEIKNSNKRIILNIDSKYYEKLYMFNYIGLKFYKNDLSIFND